MPHENRQEPRIALLCAQLIEVSHDDDTCSDRHHRHLDPIIAGIFVTLVVHILLSMLGAGIGRVLIEVGTHTLDEVYKLSWVAFAGGRSRESSQLM
jgi:hypothetical protein